MLTRAETLVATTVAGPLERPAPTDVELERFCYALAGILAGWWVKHAAVEVSPDGTA